ACWPGPPWLCQTWARGARRLPPSSRSTALDFQRYIFLRPVGRPDGSGDWGHALGYGALLRLGKPVVNRAKADPESLGGLGLIAVQQLDRPFRVRPVHLTDRGKRQHGEEGRDGFTLA